MDVQCTRWTMYERSLTSFHRQRMARKLNYNRCLFFSESKWKHLGCIQHPAQCFPLLGFNFTLTANTDLWQVVVYEILACWARLTSKHLSRCLRPLRLWTMRAMVVNVWQHWAVMARKHAFRNTSGGKRHWNSFFCSVGIFPKVVSHLTQRIQLRILLTTCLFDCALFAQVSLLKNVFASSTDRWGNLRITVLLLKTVYQFITALLWNKDP